MANRKEETRLVVEEKPATASGQQHSIQQSPIQHWRKALVPFLKSVIEYPDQPKSFLQEWWNTIFVVSYLFYIADLMHRILARPKARATKAEEAVPLKRSKSMSTNVLAKAKRILQSDILLDISAVLPVPQIAENHIFPRSVTDAVVGVAAMALLQVVVVGFV
ncbi:hypothetical protein L3X38_029073 [Prunus dulcis]|uniref:Uncharacterized protein n=1 Tax=Prunus dulcis TaxID=3755 RepID=A0AAD4Z1U7_PRUDU|nr:hypothetical protein L3X38_029073 [Prunus dulcis]